MYYHSGVIPWNGIYINLYIIANIFFLEGDNIMNLVNEKEIDVIKENLPKEFLDYLLLKDKSNQILSVSYNGKVMLLEYQQGHDI